MMRSVIGWLTAIWMALLPAMAQEPLQVAVRVAPPFVVEQDGQYEGLLIDLFEEIAAEREWQYVYHPVGLKDLLQGVEQRRFDLGLGAISASAEREAVLDFSHPVSSTGLAVATRQESRAGWQAVLSALVSPPFLRIAGGLFLLLLLLGSLVWLAERRRNPEQFGGSASDGIASGFWWAAVTMTTVGYGDKAPITPAGRFLALLWMFAALIIVSSFTAAITSALTVQHLSARIENTDDLVGKRVGSLRDSTSAAWLSNEGFSARLFDDLDPALDQLEKGELDAVLYDAPLLNYRISESHRDRLRLLPITVERQDYALALPNNSPLREALNTALLRRIAAPDWDDFLRREIGDATAH
ncbi:MAG: transporter substrate-binding domain-containing protein [Xanthomonadales bacterium]|nr:transporter substrate-binding domain-containing protein [Xanthomonadales bacterium]